MPAGPTGSGPRQAWMPPRRAGEGYFGAIRHDAAPGHDSCVSFASDRTFAAPLGAIPGMVPVPAAPRLGGASGPGAGKAPGGYSRGIPDRAPRPFRAREPAPPGAPFFGGPAGRLRAPVLPGSAGAAAAQGGSKRRRPSNRPGAGARRRTLVRGVAACRAAGAAAGVARRKRAAPLFPACVRRTRGDQGRAFAERPHAGHGDAAAAPSKTIPRGSLGKPLRRGRNLAHPAQPAPAASRGRHGLRAARRGGLRGFYPRCAAFPPELL